LALFKNRPLTWEAIQRRGWQGPGRCPLCTSAIEDLNHLLIHCEFTVNVWTRLLQFLSLTLVWKGDSVLECFADWHKNKSAPISLAATVCWWIWIERNLAIFEGRPPSCQAVIHKILSNFNWQPTSQKVFQNKVVDFSGRMALFLFSLMVLLSPAVSVVGQEALSEPTSQGLQTGFLIVELELITKLSSWVYGSHFHLQIFGL
jgi:hypothetical protein